MAFGDQKAERRQAVEGYFSLLWENEESYVEWRRNLCVRDKGYIADLNLKYVYKEICRAGRDMDSKKFFCIPVPGYPL